ncbi:hypothetical protein [Streptomyces sp. NPDC003720]|uniref:hypothetical protein n=1 Tax=Streptomyces sp. NPDC003720 TaxID=3364684 RepID=UPI00368CACAA
MPDLAVVIGRRNTPLTDCYWIQSAPCGCIASLTTTTKPRGRGVNVLETAEQAHRHMVPLKRERDDENRRGFTWQLVTKVRYHAEIGTRWTCQQHRKDV